MWLLPAHICLEMSVCFINQVLKDAKSFLLANIYKSVCENEKYASIKKRYVEGFLLLVFKWIGHHEFLGLSFNNFHLLKKFWAEYSKFRLRDLNNQQVFSIIYVRKNSEWCLFASAWKFISHTSCNFYWEVKEHWFRCLLYTIQNYFILPPTLDIAFLSLASLCHFRL